MEGNSANINTEATREVTQAEETEDKVEEVAASSVPTVSPIQCLHPLGLIPVSSSTGELFRECPLCHRRESYDRRDRE